MNEETDAPQGGAEAEAIAETPTVETNPEATTGQHEAEADDSAPADDAGAEPKPKQVPWFQKRIDELTAKKYEAEREAAYYRGKAEAAPVTPAPEEQVPDRWDDPEGYDRHLVNQAKREFREELNRDKATNTYTERVAKARETKPDYDMVVGNPSLQITPVMAQVIQESDAGTDVAYHLGTNPDEAARIASLSPHRQAAELGKLEAKLTKPPAQNRIPPPAPPQTVSGLSSGIAKQPENMSMAEYVAEAKAAGRI